MCKIKINDFHMKYVICEKKMQCDLTFARSKKKKKKKLKIKKKKIMKFFFILMKIKNKKMN